MKQSESSQNFSVSEQKLPSESLNETKGAVKQSTPKRRSDKRYQAQIGCSEEEKIRIQKRAERMGKKLSEFSRKASSMDDSKVIPRSIHFQ